MRLWAEEKKTGTNELLFTMPISEWDIVIGKFFGALIFIAIAILLTINIPITLLILGNADIGPIIGGYLGLVFVAAAFISVGLFASTTNLSASIAKMFTFLSISTHFASISRGVLDFIDIVYYIGFTSIFLWLGYIMIKKRV
jgi:ABC-2 type transport system permease protein